MSKPAHVLAIDGGGSKTAAALLTAGGEELAPLPRRAGQPLPRPGRGPGRDRPRLGAAVPSGGPAAPTGDRGRTVISAGLAGASGAPQRQAFAAAFPASPRAACRATATPPSSACSAPARAPCSRSAPASSPSAARRRHARDPQPAGASRWPTAAAAPGSACAWRASISTIWTAPPPSPRSSLWASRRRDARRRARRRSWPGSRPPAPPISRPWRRPSSPRRPPTIRWPRRCSTRVPATCCGWPTPWRRAAEAPLCLGGGLADDLPPAARSRPAGAGPAGRPRGPIPLRGAWLVATGAVPPEYPRRRLKPGRKPALTSLMLEETRAAPDRVAAMLDQDGDAYAALAAELRLRDPAFVVTVARGSSDHAALYLASLAGIVAGRITASLPPSLVTRYGAELGFERAFVVSLSQSGASPDIVRTLEAARAGGAVTAAIVNQAGLAAGAGGGPFPAAARRARAERRRDQERDRDPGRLGPPGRDVGPRTRRCWTPWRGCPTGSRRRSRCDWTPALAELEQASSPLRRRPRPRPRRRRGDRAQAQGDLGRAGRGAERRRDPARPQGGDRAGLPGPGLRPRRPGRPGFARVRRRSRRCRGQGHGGQPRARPCRTRCTCRCRRRSTRCSTRSWRSWPSIPWPRRWRAAAGATRTGRRGCSKVTRTF